MHFAIVSHSLPQPSSNGGPMACWAVLNQMLAEGHRVSVVSLRYASDPFAGPDRQASVRELGVELVTVPVRPEAELDRPAGAVTLGRNRLEAVFPTVRLGPALQSAVEELQPDAVFAYHWDTLAALHGFRAAPRLGAVGDPWHLPNLRRWQRSRPAPTRAYASWTLATLRGIRTSTSAMVELLNGCEDVAVFQASVADWLRRKGAQRASYARPPMLDYGGSGWANRRSAGSTFRILLGPSNLGATSTRAGLQLFATEVFPYLEQALGPAAFEVRIVGEGEPPPGLAARLPHPSIGLIGRIEPADDEFLGADVQLVPTPFILGQRLRIVVGWSFGCCVVAHESERANLPELEDGVNALIGRNGKGLAEAIERAVRDPELRAEVGRGGRRSYETLFHPRVAAHTIVNRLERLQ